ncbi:protein ASYMMETRIC LEAVES 2-like isoform X2 [Zingiber officinale]|uniref:LOB domain-containing protein n=2 Tax=Zingiber officinale TaxID=94328 RepID=A0A8J5GP75_ZINOF|nr:protein ASYMMETRIC LEAVES 2-like isoform X2 [Zingiber officinale]KAG6511128.1 hypothetical protein ZIOFF_029183 [Zingiber officinale]
MTSSSSPCAACKLLRRKCAPECVFAPHFPPDQPAKFANVHRVFGASNVAKLLKQLRPEQREDAVVSLAYEAEARLRDPVNGCVGYIHLLQRRLRELQHDLSLAEKELSNYLLVPAAGPHLVGLPHYAFNPSFAGGINGMAAPMAMNSTDPALPVGMLYDRTGSFGATATFRLPAVQLLNGAGGFGALLEQQQQRQYHNPEQTHGEE